MIRSRPPRIVGLRAEHRPDALGIGFRKPRLRGGFAIRGRVAPVALRGAGSVDNHACGVGSCRIRRQRSGALAVQATSLPRAGNDPRAREWHRRTGQLVERRVGRRSRTPRCCRLDGPIRDASLAGGRIAIGAAACPTGVRGSRSGCAGAAVRDCARRLRALPEQRRCRRSRSRPGWTATTTVSATRRSTSPRSCTSAGTSSAPSWATGGTAAAWASKAAAGTSTATASLSSRSSRSTTRTARRTSSGPTIRGGRPRADPRFDLYDGETYDARLGLDGWTLAGHDAAGWSEVMTIERDLATLVAPVGSPVRRIELLEPVSPLAASSGATILDFGQNLVGQLRITVQGEMGSTVALRHAEVLEDGELSSVHFDLQPRPTGTWFEVPARRRGSRASPSTAFATPRSAARAARSIRARFVPWSAAETSNARAGSNAREPLVNRLHENVVWSMRGNFVDVPTNSPNGTSGSARPETLPCSADGDVSLRLRRIPQLLARRPRS